MRARNIHLVTPSDDAYRAFSSERAQESRHLRESLPPSAAQRLSLELERVLEAWVATFVQTDDRRIVGYDLFRQNTNRYVPSYRELDSIAWTSEESAVVFEFKVSGNPVSVNKALKQLEMSGQILACRFSVPGQAVVWCDTTNGEVESDFPSLDLEAARAQLLLEMESNAVVRLSARDVWNWGVAQSLVTDSELYEQVVAEAQAAATLRAGRQELLDDGVAPDDLPERLRTRRPELPPAGSAAFGDTAPEEGTLAAKLRKALEGGR